MGGDIFGIRPIGEAFKSLTDASINAAAAFLSRICLPAAEEVGLLLRDRVRNWRNNNLVSIAIKAEKMIGPSENKHAPPRVVSQIFEYGSWTESDNVQSMWAGLLASACTEDGNDESNLMFIDTLSKLTTSQVKILDYACKRAEVKKSDTGFIHLDTAYMLSVEQLYEITGMKDFHRLDRELDHFRYLGLIDTNTGGFNPFSTFANVSPTSFALQMYARCNGHNGDPCTFYKL